MLLSIGESLNNVDFDLIMDLMRITQNRINLDLSDVNIKAMIMRSPETLEALKKE